jgi:chromate reductase, NAD(P)H dehydrogenase (quinone)
MTSLIGLSGSLRSGSLNTLLLNAAVQLMPAGSQLTTGSIRGIPLYDGDVEKHDGIPALVAQLKDQIAAADGLLLVTPEYNASIPGVFKNAIDWLTRPAEDIARVFRDRPVAVIGASPGPFGSTHAQLAWATVLRKLNTRPFHLAGQITVLHANKAFDPQGTLQDDKLRARLTDYLRDFVEFARS